MDRTPNLDLPYILPSQAQKHVTHNEAIRTLDAVVQLSVADRDLAVPPISPDEGDRFIIAAGASGDWAGREGEIAAWQDGAWAFFEPQEGWLAWVAAEDVVVAWDGTAWTVAGGSKGTFDTVGVGGATADDTNRIAVNADATLLNHDGNGHQLKINKAAAGDTASVLFQTGFSGRAEFGLAGDDDWHVKVSPNGSTWYEAIVVDGSTGGASFGPGGAADEFFTFSANSVGTAVCVRNTGGAGGAVFRAIDDSSGADWKFKTTNSQTFKLRDEDGSTDRMELLPGSTGKIAFYGPVGLPSYTVSVAPSASTAGAGAMIFVTDETGGAVPAFSDGSDWRRMTDRAVIS